MITTVDGIVSALGNNSSRVVIDKASLPNAVAGQMYSLWLATGQPSAGVAPTTVAVCNDELLGAMGFTQQTSPSKSYAAYFNAYCSNSAVTIEIHDRLVHMGGLSGVLTSSQSVGINLSSYSFSNIVERIGGTNYSDVQWWMEWYTATGPTASNATINVLYDDDTSGDLTVVAVGGTIRASRLISLNGLVPSSASGKFIKGVNSVILSASTGTAGNFGFTATRQRITMPLNLANKTEIFDWALLGFPEIYNNSCLTIIELCSTTTTGIVRGGGKLTHG